MQILQTRKYLDQILLKCITVHQVLQPLITVCATTQNSNAKRSRYCSAARDIFE